MAKRKIDIFATDGVKTTDGTPEFLDGFIDGTLAEGKQVNRFVGDFIDPYVYDSSNEIANLIVGLDGELNPLDNSQLSTIFLAKFAEIAGLNQSGTSILNQLTNKSYVDTQDATKQNLISGGTLYNILAYSGTVGTVSSLDRQITVRDSATASNTSIPTEFAVRTELDKALSKTGGTMTGTLTLFEDPIYEMEAATKNYVDTSIIGALEEAKSYTDDVLIPIVESIALKADDNAVVHSTGDETIAGVKAFTSAIGINAGLKDIDVTTAIKLGDSLNTVPSTGNKTIVGAINELNAKSTLPDQTGNSGKFVTTDGTDPSWDDVPDTFSKINNNFLNVKASEELTATHTITFDSTNNIQQLSASGSLSASTVTLVFPTTTSTESYTFELQVDCGTTVPNITWGSAETIYWNNGEVGNINDGSKMTLFIFRKQGSVVYANVGGVF